MTKKNCILYIRVSTDEQADKGYSQRHQEDILKKYCLMKDFNVVGVFKEDHSAKTFERPQFNKIQEVLKKKNHQVNLLLFTKWDRFSRNAGDAYAMISKLNKAGVEPQGIEQPLDLSVPENKMMLAFYLAAPEVENDRRSLNVIDGMRRAKKDGRYVGMAPKGYTNSRDEQGRALITPNNEGEYIKKAFEWIATGVHNLAQVRSMLEQQFNFHLSKSNFHRLVRNPLYAGLVPLSAYKDEPETLRKGIHEPLITEQMFWDIQDILNNRVRKFPTKQRKTREEFPLRSILQCKLCDGNLTGSRSRGKKGVLYNYYHCQHGCKERIKAEVVNDELEKLLNKFQFKVDVINLYYELLKTELKDQQKNNGNHLIQIEREINQFQDRISKALQLMLDGDIAPDEYKTIKVNYEKKIEELSRKKISQSLSTSNIMEQIDFVFGILKNLGNYYKTAPLDTKKFLLCSIFSEKLIFEENHYRTPIFNEVIKLILNDDKGLGGNKKGTKNQNDPSSPLVLGAGSFFSFNQFHYYTLITLLISNYAS